MIFPLIFLFIIFLIYILLVKGLLFKLIIWGLGFLGLWVLLEKYIPETLTPCIIGPITTNYAIVISCTVLFLAIAKTKEY